MQEGLQLACFVYQNGSISFIFQANPIPGNGVTKKSNT
ncbi:hypothetical protein NC652_023239 [Populus alba x Populus x berolinensis]|nr:hypothetical protein NC652_023239 [Populus alba x Populus x berolinensis]